MMKTYQLPRFGMLLSHFPYAQPLVRDGYEAKASDNAASNDEAEELLIRARVKSGDYFATLATELDKLAQGLSLARAPEAEVIERMVPELLYIDRHYNIRPK
jgi:hypothetical protein